MRFLAVAQGSEEWREARRGIPTASQFHRILTPGKLALSDSSFSYLCELVASRLLGRDISPEATQFMERGTALEEEAVRYYEFQSGETASAGGFCTVPSGLAGCSPDRLIGEKGGLEIKCPSAAIHVGYLLEGIANKYRHQVQGALWITRRQWWDILSYNPELPPALVRCYPDTEVFTALDSVMPEFLQRLEDAVAKLTKDGPQGLVEHPSQDAPVEKGAPRPAAAPSERPSPAKATAGSAPVKPPGRTRATTTKKKTPEPDADGRHPLLGDEVHTKLRRKFFATLENLIGRGVLRIGAVDLRDVQKADAEVGSAARRALYEELGYPIKDWNRVDPETLENLIAEMDQRALKEEQDDADPVREKAVKGDLAAFLVYADRRGQELGREFVRTTRSDSGQEFHWFMSRKILEKCGADPSKGLNLNRVGAPVISALAQEVSDQGSESR